MSEKFDLIGNSIAKANPERTHTNLIRRLLKLSEELGEVAEAYLNVTSNGNGKAKTWDDVREELVDLIIVSMDCALTPMPDQENHSSEEIQNEIAEWIDKKLKKWQNNKVKGTVTSDAE